MIKDNLQHIAYYNYLTKGIQLGLKYISETDFSNMENGKYQIIEDKLFAIVQDYDSKPAEEGKFEAHKKFIDIQFIVKGEEKVGVVHIDECTEAVAYDEEKDIYFLSPNEDSKVEFVNLKEGEYVILTTKDAHMPSIAVDTPSYVKKVVVKVKA